MAYDVGIVASVTMKRTDEVAGGRYASGRSGRCRCPSGARCQGAPPYVIRFVSWVSGLVIGGPLATCSGRRVCRRFRAQGLLSAFTRDPKHARSPRGTPNRSDTLPAGPRWIRSNTVIISLAMAASTVHRSSGSHPPFPLALYHAARGRRLGDLE